MVIYENYQPFRSWLRKIDNGLIKVMAKGQAKKKRQGNVFMVAGANGYVGWALICQLVYKFSGCKIIAVDKDIDSQNSITRHESLGVRMQKLKEIFDFEAVIYRGDLSKKSVCEFLIEDYNPDFIINMADGNSKKNPVLDRLLEVNKKAHLIVSTGYKSDFEASKNYKITDFKTSNVVGTCNWITLIDPIISTKNDPDKLVNRIIKECAEKGNSTIDSGFFPMLSLEDFTRAVVKIIRKGQKNNYERYFAIDKIIPADKLSTIIKNTLRDLGYKSKIIINPKDYRRSKIRDKKRFVKLIDKHRPPVEYMISYSCKNFLDAR